MAKTQRRFEVVLDEDGRLVEAFTHGHRWRRELPDELVSRLEEIGEALERELDTAPIPAESDPE